MPASSLRHVDDLLCVTQGAVIPEHGTNWLSVKKENKADVDTFQDMSKSGGFAAGQVRVLESHFFDPDRDIQLISARIRHVAMTEACDAHAKDFRQSIKYWRNCSIKSN